MNSPGKRLDLAHSGPFDLGALKVEPAVRLVRNGADSLIIEPRVMQLLVAFHEARGNVLSRDDLVDQCWGGVIVGDNAVQRAISQARKLAATIGEGSFAIETVRGVGYRLVEQGVASHAADQGDPARARSSWLTRRTAAAAIGIGAAAIAAPVVVTRLRGPGQSDLAEEFYRRGRIQLHEEDFLAAADAEKNFRNALRLSPDFPEAWNGLALSYWQQMFNFDDKELDRLAALTVSAGRRALALGADIAATKAILLLVEPCFRNWDKLRPPLERLAEKRPGSWFILRMLGWLAADTGDEPKAIDCFNRALKAEPLLPLARVHLAYAFWAANRLAEAEQVLADAQQFWPKNYYIWEYLFEFLLFSGDTAAAKRLLSNESRTPTFVTDVAIPRRFRLIRALETGASGDIEAALKEQMQLTRLNSGWTATTALLMASLGADDQMFELLDGYFLGRGQYAKTIQRYARRPTGFLFLPPMHRLHSDSRFSALLSTIGLP